MSISVGVLGLGSIGLRHARNLVAAGIAVEGFDPSPERRGAFAAAGGVATDERVRLMNSVDALVVATPSERHLDDLAEAVEAGKHVYVEKPLAHSATGLERVLEKADAQGLTLFAGLNLRYHPGVRAARAIRTDGALGEPLWARFLAASYLPEWRPGQDYRAGYAADPASGGVLFDFIHEFDLAVHLLGPAKIKAASARRTGMLDLASEDCADVVLNHHGGVQSAIHVDYVTLPRQRRVEIAGTCGLLRLDLEANHLLLVDRDGRTVEEHTYVVDGNDMYVDAMHSFLDCIRNGSRPACSGWEAFEVLNLVIAARRLSGLPAQ